MFAFIIRRVLQAILVMFIISFIGFALKQNVGDPVREITGISVSAAEREAIREKIKEKLLTQGALTAHLCGSGGSLFGLFKTREEAAKAKLVFREEFVYILSI